MQNTISLTVLIHGGTDSYRHNGIRVVGWHEAGSVLG